MTYLLTLLACVLWSPWSDIDLDADRRAWIAGLVESAHPWTPQREA